MLRLYVDLSSLPKFVLLILVDNWVWRRQLCGRSLSHCVGRSSQGSTSSIILHPGVSIIAEAGPRAGTLSGWALLRHDAIGDWQAPFPTAWDMHLAASWTPDKANQVPSRIGWTSKQVWFLGQWGGWKLKAREATAAPLLPQSISRAKSWRVLDF
jgi:hypothetical protein